MFHAWGQKQAEKASLNSVLQQDLFFSPSCLGYKALPGQEKARSCLPA